MKLLKLPQVKEPAQEHTAGEWGPRTDSRVIHADMHVSDAVLFKGYSSEQDRGVLFTPLREPTLREERHAVNKYIH